PERFSEKVLQTLNAEQIERALDLLLGLYRDIRYSISPRFELEVVVSKLCLLDKWVSPLELRFAIAGARELLVSSRERKSPADGKSASMNSGYDSYAVSKTAVRGAEGGGGSTVEPPQPESLSEGFKRYLANRETAAGEDKQDRKISPQAERVLRIFNGTIVN
ncbi:MAG: hypothetical protein LBH85_00845, partial [Treponema sp.]|nr:hypothetical protein [Treponema sp.]